MLSNSQSLQANAEDTSNKRPRLAEDVDSDISDDIESIEGSDDDEDVAMQRIPLRKLAKPKYQQTLKTLVAQITELEQCNTDSKPALYHALDVEIRAAMEQFISSNQSMMMQVMACQLLSQLLYQPVRTYNTGIEKKIQTFQNKIRKPSIILDKLLAAYEAAKQQSALASLANQQSSSSTSSQGFALNVLAKQSHISSSSSPTPSSSHSSSVSSTTSEMKAPKPSLKSTLFSRDLSNA